MNELLMDKAAVLVPDHIETLQWCQELDLEGSVVRTPTQADPGWVCACGVTTHIQSLLYTLQSRG